MICRIRKLEAEPTEVEGCDASACLQRPFPTLIPVHLMMVKFNNTSKREREERGERGK